MLTPQDTLLIKELLDTGQPIPREYRDLMFPPNKREAELVYAAKERQADVLAGTMAVPLQPIKTFGGGGEGWHNMLIFGDNLQVMKGLLKMKKDGDLINPDGSSGIRLVYIDPPFATRQEFSNKDERAYADRLAGTEFIEFLRKRIIYTHELLTDDGAFYIHLDSRKVHYIKVILDEVFGESGLSQEIIWKRTSAHSDSKGYSNIHETILFYPKSRNFYYNPIFDEYSDEHIARRYKHTDDDGRRYTDGDLTAYGLKGGGYVYEWNGHTKEWRCPIETMRQYEQENKIYYTRNGVPRIKRYLDEVPGVAPQDMWLNIPPVNSQAEERVNYPTQKPERLLARIVESSSKEGDIVLDAFAGSGTTLAVAEKLKRKWIGIDSGKLAIYTIQKRMLNLNRHVGSFAIDSRKTLDLIPNGEDLNKAPGAFIVTNKARKGQLNVDLNFIKDLRKTFKAVVPNEFWVTCPRDKFMLPGDAYDIDEDGYYFVKHEGVVFKFSLLEEKKGKTRKEALDPKPFTLYHAGLYDFMRLSKSSWKVWREFALLLFECRDEPHIVGGIDLDGYRGNDDVMVFNHMQGDGVMLDTTFVRHLHEEVGSKLGSRFFIIAPAAHVQFLQDYIEHGATRYYVLRIPYSIINELHRRDFEALTQPVSQDDLNSIVDAVGFDFMMVPRVECQYAIETREGQLLEEAVISINIFKSQAMAKGASLKGNRESLSLVMLDYEYDEETFDFDTVLYADAIEKAGWKVRMPLEEMGDRVMIVYMDIYGNEYREVKTKADFGRRECLVAVGNTEEANG